MKSLLLAIALLFSIPYATALTLTIGTTRHNPPFSSFADKKDHFYGFDIDIMGEICRRIQAKCQFSPLLFDHIANQLKAGQIDAAIASIIITEKSQQDFLFSLPYLESNGQFITKEDSPINKPEEITNKYVGVRLGTPFAELARKIYKEQVKITPYPDMPQLMEGLADGQVNVILTNDKAARYWCANMDHFCKLIGSKIPIGDGYGIMTRPDQKALIAKINQALLAIEADGTYVHIYSRYFDN